MLLKNKNAIIYGGGGAIGGTVARAFAREGAKVFLAGRTIGKLDKVRKEISDAGGECQLSVVNATDRDAVDAYVSKIADEAGRIDVSFNAISFEGVQGDPLLNMKCGQFSLPIANAMNSHFITATAAARHMTRELSGVILAITANAGYEPFVNVGGFGVACAAIEAFCRQLAVEIGEYGVRVVCLRSAGSPDAPGVDYVFKQHAKNEGITGQEFENRLAQRTMLKRLPTLQEVANAAVLMASDRASAITAAVANVTCGEIAD